MMIYVKYAMVMVWMIVIFLLSNEPATISTVRSSVLLDAVQSFDVSILKSTTELVVRKSAHFIEYLVLGVLLINMVRAYRITGSAKILMAVGIAAAYACADELHQLFVVGRNGQARDVIVDIVGAVVGVIIYSYVFKRSLECTFKGSNTV